MALDYLDIDLYGHSINLGNNPTKVELDAASGITKLSMEVESINIIPTLVGEVYEDTNQNKFRFSDIRYTGTLVLKIMVAPAWGTTQTGAAFYSFIAAVNKPFVYLISGNYPVEINPTEGRRIVISEITTDLINTGSYKKVTLKFEFGGIE